MLPVDNVAPSIILGGPLLVDEGRKSTITKEVLFAQDVDTIMRDLKVFITKQPTWGFIENTNPASGTAKKAFFATLTYRQLAFV